MLKVPLPLVHPTSQQEGIWHVASIVRRHSGRNRPPYRIGLAMVVRGGGWKCQDAEARPAQESKAAEKDPFEVPDGTIEELQKYIDGLNKIQPSSSLRPAVAELHKKRAASQLKACEKILAAKPTPEQAQAAVRVKVAALVLLGRLGDATAQARLEATVGSSRETWPEGNGPRRSVGGLGEPRRASRRDEGRRIRPVRRTPEGVLAARVRSTPRRPSWP